MLIIIKSFPDTPEARQALDLAKSMNAGVCLVQNGVYLTVKEECRNIAASVFALSEDMALRGLKPAGNVKSIDYDELIDIMNGSEKVMGMF
jgi:sulfur relay protein TusB/DsrH